LIWLPATCSSMATEPTPAATASAAVAESSSAEATGHWPMALRSPAPDLLARTPAHRPPLSPNWAPSLPHPVSRWNKAASTSTGTRPPRHSPPSATRARCGWTRVPSTSWAATSKTQGSPAWAAPVPWARCACPSAQRERFKAASWRVPAPWTAACWSMGAPWHPGSRQGPSSSPAIWLWVPPAPWP
jgi:hypothetical protein